MEMLEVWKGGRGELISPKINLHFLKIIVHVIFFFPVHTFVLPMYSWHNSKKLLGGEKKDMFFYF